MKAVSARVGTLVGSGVASGVGTLVGSVVDGDKVGSNVLGDVVGAIVVGSSVSGALVVDSTEGLAVSIGISPLSTMDAAVVGVVVFRRKRAASSKNTQVTAEESDFDVPKFEMT